MPLVPPYNNLNGWLIDMDGVLYRGTEAIPYARRFIAALDEGGYQYLYFTNNATRTPDQFVDHLAAFGIGAPVERVFSSAMATAAYLAVEFPAPKNVVVVGGAGIRAALQEAGYRLVSRYQDADLVVSALDQDTTYWDMAEAALAIGDGCPWVATNGDPSLPSERGILPGAGAIIALLEAATGQTPVVVGKPETIIFDQALKLLGTNPQETVMLGDRLTTDILGGSNAGVRTMCVLTGIASLEEAETYSPRPDWIIPDLAALMDTNE